MKYRLMGIEKKLKGPNMKVSVIGMRDGQVIKHAYPDSGKIHHKDLVDFISDKARVKKNDIKIPGYIRDKLK